MDIELLVVPDCANEQSAQGLIRAVLADLHITTATITTTIIDTSLEAERRRFTGSPTILLNGHDPFTTDSTPALACRVYQTRDGLRGIPDSGDLRQALQLAAARLELTQPGSVDP